MEVIKKKVKIVEENKYVANDGEIFDTKKQCLSHENKLKENNEASKRMAINRDYYKFEKVDLIVPEDSDSGYFEYNTFDMVYLQKEEDAQGIINCYRYITSSYNDIIEISDYDVKTYPCWVFIGEETQHCHSRLLIPVSEYYNQIAKTYNTLFEIVNRQ